MNWKLLGFMGSLAIAIVVLALVFSTRSKAQTVTHAPVAYAYKVEHMNKNAKDMDRILSDDGKEGWRVWRVEAVGTYHNDLVFLMERPVNSSTN